MQIKKVFSIALFLLILISCEQNKIQNIEVQIIPKPLNQRMGQGFFELSSNTGLNYPEDFKISAEFLKSFIEQSKSIRLKEGHEIHFSIDKTIASDEGYILKVSPETIEIKAKTDKGAFYAVQSLRQMFPGDFETGNFDEDKLEIPATTISDVPHFSYRGMHLDVGRHMYSVDFIKKYIDALAMLKMNTFHWHLTEDQGWRVEIKKYPKLQEVSAYRNETLKGHYSDQPQQFDGKRYGGYYTQEEVKEVVAYAQERFVTVIPEIEMPGHSQAAIAAYPQLGCTEEQVEVATKWGVFEDIYCTKEETFDFLEDVFDEVLELFPSEYIHIGGDEAPKTRWKECPNCQKRIKEEGLKDEHELQNYFITRMEKYLNSKGRQIIGWDEILEGGLAPNATVMSWRGTSGAVEAAKSGHNVVMTPTSHCYFDYYQSENEDEPTAIGGYLPLEKVYAFNPIPEELTEEESQYVLGAQGNVWTEYIPTEDQVEYMVFPRIFAMSEVVWSSPSNKNFPDFVNRVEHFHDRLKALNINYANHLYALSGQLQNEDEQLSYKLETVTKGKTILYTIDGTEPTFKSETYSNPIPLNESVNIKAAVFKNNERLGSFFSESINLHKAVAAKITIDKEPHKAFIGSGAEGLINGISGSDSRFGDKEWLGFWGEDIEITIDLGSEIEINSIETRFYNGNGQWIYAPRTLEIAFDNEKDFKTYELSPENLVLIFKADFKDVKANTITIKVPNYGTIPDGKQGAGNEAWTFIDEIIVN